MDDPANLQHIRASDRPPPVGRHRPQTIEKELTNRKQPSGDALHRMELDRLDDLERRTREAMDDGRVLLAIDRL